MTARRSSSSCIKSSSFHGRVVSSTGFRKCLAEVSVLRILSSADVNTVQSSTILLRLESCERKQRNTSSCQGKWKAGKVSRARSTSGGFRLPDAVRSHISKPVTRLSGGCTLYSTFCVLFPQGTNSA